MNKKMGEMENEVEKSTEFVKWFSKADKTSTSLTGFKGSKLGELFIHKFPVPNGFVVTSEAYRNFLDSSGLFEKISALLSKTNLDDINSVEEVSPKIKELILHSELPEELKEEILDSYSVLGTNKLEIEKGSARDILNNASEPVFVAVRSSVCFKSDRKIKRREQDTYLNVKGNEDVLEHVKKVYASLFNPETISGELKVLGFENFKISVIIQKMVDGEKSGSVISNDSSLNISLSAIWGIGEGFNLKEILPDEYVLSRELEILEKKIGVKPVYVARDSSGSLKALKSSDERNSSQVLSDYEMKRLGDFAEKIETHFGSCQKIDFSVSDSEIYILDSADFKISSGEDTNNRIKEVKSKEVIEKEDLERQPKPVTVEKVEKVTKTKLKLVLESPDMIEEGEKTGLKKIGILKIEKTIQESGKHPLYFLNSNNLNQYENLIYDGINLVSQNFEEVWVRTSDFLTNEFLKLEGAPNSEFIEENPLIGLHGIRFGLKYPGILEAELRAFKKVSGNTLLGVLIPNIISVNELKEVKKVLKKINFENLKVGVLIETPASIQLIKDFCAEGVDSFVINIDRLSESLLSIDTSNSEVKKLLDYMHPSIIYQIEYLIRVARRNNVETNIFGKGVTNKDFLDYILQKGINFISVFPENAKSLSDKISSIENDFLKIKDSDPRKYEMEKVKGEYIKEDHEIKKFSNKNFENSKKKTKVPDTLGIF
ncbi:MAG: hypothetical protein NUV46_03005 [Nanoarchaeota archaeon]|nr:hypothetical protein [Nanoarchaeota archaeon]